MTSDNGLDDEKIQHSQILNYSIHDSEKVQKINPKDEGKWHARQN